MRSRLSLCNVKNAIAGLVCNGLMVWGTYAQSTYFSTEAAMRSWLYRMEVAQGRSSDSMHLSQWPVSRQTVVGTWQRTEGLHQVQQQNVRFLLTDQYEWWDTAQAKSRKPVARYFYNYKAAFLSHYGDDFFVRIDPVLSVFAGWETADSALIFFNARGLVMRGWVGRAVGFSFFVTENQLFAPSFVRQWISRYQAVPYQGYYKEFKDGGVDFFDARGYVTFTAARYLHFQLGHDKNLLGNGLRSLVLSDFSNRYFFLRVQTRVRKISYQNLFIVGTAPFLRTADRLLPPKYAAVHHLSWQPFPTVNIGLWESVVFHRNQGYELQYLNPLIFYRAVEQGLGSPDNTLLGLDGRVNIRKGLQWYGQLALDDYNFQFSKGQRGYWGNKFGIQQGLRYTDAFTVPNLDLQLEWNAIRPYMYSHSDTLVNYSNYNAPLAHPLGANLSEWLLQLQYQPRFPFRFTATWMHVNQGADSAGSHWGSNIFLPTTMQTVMQQFDNRIGQGIAHPRSLLAGTFTWMMKHNLFLDLHYTYRREGLGGAATHRHTHLFTVGIRWNADRYDWWF